MKVSEFKIQKLIELLRDGKSECNKLDNRGYISMGELIMKFYDVTYREIVSLRRPENKRNDLKFILCREHTHIKWIDNKFVDRTIAFRMPFKTSLRKCFRNLS